jgi:hypothetical protein
MEEIEPLLWKVKSTLPLLAQIVVPFLRSNSPVLSVTTLRLSIHYLVLTLVLRA